jgi:tetratricopeptide (TPR) repeat protein
VRIRAAQTLSVVTAAVMLTGCSTTAPSSGKAWRIEPVLKVAHSTVSSQGYYLLGRYHDGGQAWHKSVEAYRKALAADPDHVDARNALGVALARLGLYGQAEVELRQALAAAPQRADLHSNLGYLLLLARRSEEAVAVLQTALRLEPRDSVAQVNLRLAQEHGRADAPHMARADAGPSAIPAAATQSHAAAVLAAAAPAQAAATAAQAAAPAGPVPEAAVAPGAAPTSSDVQPLPAAGQAPVAGDTFSVELTNGLGRAGAARRLGQHLEQQGVGVRHLSNLPPYGQAFTLVQYRLGMEVEARRVASMLPLAPQLQAQASQRTDVRVVLGHDWPQAVAVAVSSGPLKQ